MACLLAACAEKSDSAALPPEADDGVRSEAFQVEYLFSDTARVLVRLTAPRVVERDEDPDNGLDDDVAYYLYGGVHMDFYSPSGRPHSQLDANEGIYWPAKGLAELKGNVRMTNSMGHSLAADQLFWDEYKDQIYNKSYVRIQTPGRSVIADSGLVSNSAFTRYELKQVRGSLEYGDF